MKKKIKKINKCIFCGSKIKREGSSLHVWDIEFECGCVIIGALDTKTHGDGYDVHRECPNKPR